MVWDPLSVNALRTLSSGREREYRRNPQEWCLKKWVRRSDLSIGHSALRTVGLQALQRLKPNFVRDPASDLKVGPPEDRILK
jgi:hypothetical protein